MGEFDDALERIRESGFDGEADLFERLNATTLRKRAGEAEQLKAENERLKSEVEEVKARPARIQAFQKYGVDLEQLRPAERAVLESLKPAEGETLDDEWIANQIERFQFPTKQAEEQETEEPPAAGKIAAAAKTAPRGGPVKTKIEAEEVNDWATDKQMRFRKEHPSEWEALLRGESVTGVTAA